MNTGSRSEVEVLSDMVPSTWPEDCANSFQADEHHNPIKCESCLKRLCFAVLNSLEANNLLKPYSVLVKVLHPIRCLIATTQLMRSWFK